MTGMNPEDMWGDWSTSSPLGSVRDDFLRYAVVLSSPDTLTSSHKKRLEDAASETEKNGEGIVERIGCGDAHVLLLIGVSVDATPQSVIDDFIIAANGTEPFLRFHFLMTNMRVPNAKEIAEYLREIS